MRFKMAVYIPIFLLAWFLVSAQHSAAAESSSPRFAGACAYIDGPAKLRAVPGRKVVDEIADWDIVTLGEWRGDWVYSNRRTGNSCIAGNPTAPIGWIHISNLRPAAQLARGAIPGNARSADGKIELRVNLEGARMLDQKVRWPSSAVNAQEWKLLSTGNSNFPFVLILEPPFSKQPGPSAIAFFGAGTQHMLPFEQVRFDQILRGRILINTGSPEGEKWGWSVVDLASSPPRLASVEDQLGFIAMGTEMHAPRCQPLGAATALIDAKPGSGPAKLAAGSWVRLHRIMQNMVEVEIGDSASLTACETSKQMRRARIPLGALKQPALLAHDFIPQIDDQPLFTIGAKGDFAYGGSTLFPYPNYLSGFFSAPQNLLEHWTVFTGDPAAPFLLLFSGGFNDVYQVPPRAALLGGQKPQLFQPGLGDRELDARLVGISPEGMIVNEPFHCFIQTRTTWAVRDGNVKRLHGDFRFNYEVELADGEPARRIDVYEVPKGGTPRALVVDAPAKLQLLRVDYESGRVLISWKAKKYWVNWEAMKKEFEEPLFNTGGCGAG
jgi:hypothetical protein